MKKQKVKGFEKYLTETLKEDIYGKELFLQNYYRQPITTQVAMFRKCKGLSQVLLGTKAKIAQQQIARFEKIGNNPRLSTIEKLTEALGGKLILVTPHMISAIINKELLAQGESYFSKMVFGNKNKRR